VSARRLLYGAIVFVCVMISMSNATYGEPAREANMKRQALSCVDQFAYFVNAGLFRMAARLVSPSMPAISEEDARAALLDMLDGVTTSPEHPVLVVAKRSATIIGADEVEVRCVLIWNLVRKGEETLRIESPERFVARVMLEDVRLVSAHSLPLVVQYHQRPQELHRAIADAAMFGR